MNMKKIEADSLEEAYKNAAKALNCSITEIDYEIVQYPTTGVMGLFKKQAIIIAIKKRIPNGSTKVEIQEEEVLATKPSVVEPPKEKQELSSEEKPIKEESFIKKQEILTKELSKKGDAVLDSFFETKRDEDLADKPIKNNVESEYFEHAFDDDRDSPQNRKLSIEIENKLKVLFASSCFEIDTVEVDVFNNTAHMFIDGEDAALLIGKEGYRYNALSYMLFNWINAQYDLYIKLEIAEFIQTQEEMISNYLKPIIEHIKDKGRGKTKPLDGILVQIALEQLRAVFPNKYVAIKTGKDGNKFIIINNFNNKKNG